ncbi:MAG: inositol monophosphatase family protein [Pseudomonadota bacterium]
MSQALHPMLNTAIKAARSAGAIINRASLDLDLLKVNTKSPNDFVTEVDHKAEAAIIETLLGAYPGHGILAEESGRAHGAKDSEFVWIIDPLDGTTNFIHGFPVYSVSIALAFRGQVQQGVVYDPTRNDLFYASKGRGAFLNDRRLRVSKRVRLADCLIGTGFPFRKGDSFKRYMQMMEAVMPTCAGLRRPGSAALDLCYVAAGYTDGFFETGLSPWDIAAGSLLVTEAGGLIGNFTGEADYLYQRECLAASPRIYGQLVGLLSPFTHVIAPDAATPGDSAIGLTPADALAAGVAIERDPDTAPPAPVKKSATRIGKDVIAREKQAAADADRSKPPRARSPRRGDAPF